MREAKKYLDYLDKCLPFLLSIYKSRHYRRAGPQSLTNSIAQLLAKESLHPGHRFWMVPYCRARMWNIPGLSPAGSEFLAWLPTILGMGDFYNTRLPLDKAVEKAKSLHHTHILPNL